MSDTTNDTFRIDRLTLKNFRCFEEKTIDFHPRFNVLIGDNGSGKTAVLRGLAVAFRPYVFWVTDGKIAGEVGTAQDIRAVMYQSAASGAVHAEPQECEVAGGAVFRGGQAHWRVLLNEGERSTMESVSQPPADHGWADLGAEARRGKDVTLPIAAYYRAERLWAQTEVQDVAVLTPRSRLDGYANWAAPAAALGDVFAWLRTSRLVALEEQRGDPGLAALDGGIRDALGNSTPIAGVEWSVKFGQPLVRFREGRGTELLPFAHLSHGWATTLALVADVVRRCAGLNPHLGADAARETPGVVLVDEIDLHLHPSWQRHVVDDLKRAFPKVQFIVTTHSPIIVQSLRPGELIKLDGEVRDEYADKSVEDVLEAAMGVDEPYRSERYQRMARAARQYQRLLRRGESAKPEEREKLRRQLDELIAPFSDNIAYYAFLEAEREAAGLGDGDS
jgi:predicted ATP-binding protein involved in virulence